jgi:ankyrin repeat protein
VDAFACGEPEGLRALPAQRALAAAEAAASAGQVGALAEVILKGVGLDLGYAVLLAAAAGKEDVFILLKDCGAELEWETDFGTKPAHVAAQNGHARILSILRDAGCDLGVRMSDGATPAHLAALGGHSRVLELLLDAGCDLQAQMSDGTTPAQNASQNGHIEALQLLLKIGDSHTALSDPQNEHEPIQDDHMALAFKETSISLQNSNKIDGTTASATEK